MTACIYVGTYAKYNSGSIKGAWLDLEDLVSQSRAVSVATALFPDEIANGSDCLNETGRGGEPCRICGSRNQAWEERVREVRAAMMHAFK